MAETFLDGRVTLHCGDCLETMRTLPNSSIDSCVTDPPYHLTSIVKRFSKTKESDDTRTSERVRNRVDGYARLVATGFMGKKWDGGDIAFRPEVWAEVLRVLKPGAHLLAFGGTRTYHRMASAIEDAGFEIRDMTAWLYGSGFPKSHDVAKSLGRELAGPDLCAEWDGWGTALKPALEPICIARKPLIGTVAQNVLKHRAGALNIDGCRIGTKTDILGRWPANVIHDGSEEVVAAFPEEAGAFAPVRGTEPSSTTSGMIYGLRDRVMNGHHGDSGSAARFFYTPKADADDRLGSRHPTVKPLDLKQYLIRLVTPKGGTVLDPFAGTGTTGEAAWREGMSAVLIEREAEYQDDIRRRMALAISGPDERARASMKEKMKDKPRDDGPLFGGADADANSR